MSSTLTSDNTHLSEPTMGHEIVPTGPDWGLANTVAEYVREAVSDNTRRAYRSDLAHFTAWGGSVPCSPEMIAAYIAQHAHRLTVATLQRRLAAISTAHAAQGHQSPTTAKLVQVTLRGIRRAHGVPQRAASPLLVEDLLKIMAVLSDHPKDLRDRALLLVGFAGGFRRSELVALDYDDVEMVRQGIILTIRRSKIDQEGQGRKVGIPYGRGQHCPVLALDTWLERAGIEGGNLFRPVTRHGRIGDERLSGEAVALVVKQRVAQIGLDPTDFSGHSLRADLATSAAMAGVSSWKIRQQTGHASDAMLQRYIRDGELFVGNAAGALL